MDIYAKAGRWIDDDTFECVYELIAPDNFVDDWDEFYARAEAEGLDVVTFQSLREMEEFEASVELGA